MGLLTTEANHMRKSHRIDLPISVQVGDVTYKALDWSMTGVALDGYSEPLKMDEVVEANLRLPMNASALILQVNLKFKRQSKAFSGFEFVDLPPQVRRVLRQYIELAVDGKLDNIEDMMGVLTTATIDSPLESALTLSDIEQDSMLEHFKTGSRTAIIAGVALFLIIVGSLFYTTNYRISGTGMVSSTLLSFRAPLPGIVQDLNVMPGEMVKGGEKLFSIMEIDYRTGRAKPLKPAVHQNDQLDRELAAAVEQQQADFTKVKQLYAKHIVSLKDLNYIHSQLRRARIAYARYAGVDDGSAITPLESEVRANSEVHSIQDGHVFTIDIQDGMYVNPGDVVLVLEADTTPDIIYKVKNYDAIKIHVGMPVTVQIPYNGQKLEAAVSAIGYSAIYGETSPTQEASLNETLVKIKLKDSSIRLPANTRVNVWMRTFQWFW